MRSPAAMDIIQIDANVACPKRCSNCTRLVDFQTKKWEMDIETFERAVRSMDGWLAPGKVLGLIGGEVTLHSDFERIARRFAELWGGPLTQNGRMPIRNYDRFVQERLFDRSNGRGLWTSLGPSFYRHIETIYEVFSHFNVNTHEGPAALHQANLIHRKDYIAATGISEEQWETNRNNCWLQAGWSATITPKGAFFCEQAAAIDMLYFDGKHGWPIEQGWWQRQPEDFKDQLHLCDYCSLAQPAPSSLDKDERHIVSKTSRDMLIQIGLPETRLKRIDLYDPAVHDEKRVIDRKDNYVGPSGQRVGDENESTRPKKTTLVVVCVGRAEHLKQTLPHNAKLVDEVVVITHPRDLGTIDIHHAMCGKAIKGFLSERCFENGDAFNKGKMINDALAGIKDPDWIILSDADIFLSPNLPEFMKTHSLNPGVIYGTVRHTDVDGPIGSDKEPNGFFQLFHPRAQAIRDNWPHPMSEEFCSAGSVDSHFLQQFPQGKRCLIPSLAVKHLDHGPLAGGWNGPPKVAGSGGWRQFGIITTAGMAKLPNEKTTLPCMIKLTDTLHGKTAIFEHNGENFPIDIINTNDLGLVFLGVVIGSNHVHVAWKELP